MPRAIVFLHGFTHTARSWDSVIGALGQRYRPIAVDLRGHGTAASRRPVGFAECVADVLGAAPDVFTLVGYSMGARLALHVALAQPDRVERLVLIGGTAGLADPAERGARRQSDEELAAQVEAGTIEEFARRWETQPVLKGQPPGVVEAARADRLRNTPDGLAAALRGLGTGVMEPLWGRLDELGMPVTLIVGERDAKFRKLAERMAARLPRAEVLVVPACGHAVHLEAPAIVSACLRERVPVE